LVLRQKNNLNPTSSCASKGLFAAEGIIEEKEDEEEDADDSDEDTFESPGAPGMLTTADSATRWFCSSEGRQFAAAFVAAARKKENTDGMRTTSHEWMGAIVRRSFGPGVVSFGKVVGWFPEEEHGGQNDGGALFHVIHGDGDEEDLDVAEMEEALLLR